MSNIGGVSSSFKSPSQVAICTCFLCAFLPRESLMVSSSANERRLQGIKSILTRDPRKWPKGNSLPEMTEDGPLPFAVVAIVLTFSSFYLRLPSTSLLHLSLTVCCQGELGWTFFFIVPDCKVISISPWLVVRTHRKPFTHRGSQLPLHSLQFQSSVLRDYPVPLSSSTYFPQGPPQRALGPGERKEKTEVRWRESKHRPIQALYG